MSWATVGARGIRLVAERRVQHIGHVHELVPQQRQQRAPMEERLGSQPDDENGPGIAPGLLPVIMKVSPFLFGGARPDNETASDLLFQGGMLSQSVDERPGKPKVSRPAGVELAEAGFPSLGDVDFVNGVSFPVELPSVGRRGGLHRQQDTLFHEVRIEVQTLTSPLQLHYGKR